MKEPLPPPADVKSVACLMLGEIGDLLVTTPTLSSLKAHYPGSKLSLITRSHLADLVRNNPDVDEIVSFESGNPLAKGLFLARISIRHWDLWVDLHTPTYNTVCSNERVFRRNALLMRSARSRYRLGFAMPEMLPYLTHPVPVPDEKTLQTENIVDTTRRITYSNGEACGGKKLIVDDESLRWAGDLLGKYRLDTACLVGLCFGAKQPASRWPLPRIAEFCERARTGLPGYRFLLFGGPYEKGLSADLRNSLADDTKSRIVDLVGSTSLLQTAALMSMCRAVVTTDSGPMHIADALGTPMVALFSSHGYLPVWKPLNAKSHVLNAGVPCRHCLLSACDNDNLCMQLIDPRDVLLALDRLLAQVQAEINHA